ncbi:MAG: hypothetical protein ACXWEH_06645 [Actinomycetota bacterium]
MDEQLECDLVMKGGITSGVVYPPAILRLKERYRFRNIGGASVGAIAAAVAAAAEYGRQMGTGGFEPLAEISAELPREGFLQSLFQPRRELRSLYRILVESTKPSRARVLRMAWALVRSWWGATVFFGGVWAGTLVWAVAADRWYALAVAAALWLVTVVPIVLWLPSRGRLRTLSVVAAPLGFFLWPLGVVAVWMAAASFRAVDRPGAGFGICTGMPADGRSDGALTTWLHDKIQRSAGLGAPLTFRHLEEAGVHLEVTSTDLSLARPVAIPAAFADYLFTKPDMEALFPDDVVEHLVRMSTPFPGTQLRRLSDPSELPVLVAFRLSMSFPILFTAVPLYGLGPRVRNGDGSPAPVPHWLSDGGIGSNFPIHFFDAWLPRRPTFGLSLGPFPQTPSGARVTGAPDVDLRELPTDEAAVPWVKVTSAFGLARQILDTMENWRDTMQSELPGFRERVCRINLAEGEGGMNIGMQRDAIDSLIAKGTAAGDALVERFRWPQHRLTRYVLMMQMLQRRLLGETDPLTGTRSIGLRESFADYRGRLARGEVDADYLWGRDAAWCAAAAEQTDDLLRLADGWIGPPESSGPQDVDLFDGGDPPRPRGVMRIVPPV